MQKLFLLNSTWVLRRLIFSFLVGLCKNHRTLFILRLTCRCQILNVSLCDSVNSQQATFTVGCRVFHLNSLGHCRRVFKGNLVCLYRCTLDGYKVCLAFYRSLLRWGRLNLNVCVYWFWNEDHREFHWVLVSVYRVMRQRHHLEASFFCLNSITDHSIGYMLCLWANLNDIRLLRRANLNEICLLSLIFIEFSFRLAPRVYRLQFFNLCVFAQVLCQLF